MHQSYSSLHQSYSSCPINPRNATGLGEGYDRYKARASLALRSAACSLELDILKTVSASRHIYQFTKQTLPNITLLRTLAGPEHDYCCCKFTSAATECGERARRRTTTQHIIRGPSGEGRASAYILRPMNRSYQLLK